MRKVVVTSFIFFLLLSIVCGVMIFELAFDGAVLVVE